MDAEDARADLEQASRSYQSAVHPVLPRWVPPLCAVLVAGGTALVGAAPSDGLARLACTAGGVALAVAAGAVVFWARARGGVSGLRGPARDSGTALIVCGIAFLVSAMSATAQTRWMYAGLGLVTGAITWWVLARRHR